MKAYAILDGGGVKGAALAGCLKAAEQLGIEFVAFGGTSAGSIVALLAALGFRQAQLHHVTVEEIEFTAFLDDDGVQLNKLKSLLKRIFKKRLWGTAWIRRLNLLFWKLGLIRRLNVDLGLYDGQKLKRFLLEKIKAAKTPQFDHHKDITFRDLEKAGCVPLKIVASDIGLCRHVVYSGSGGDEINGSVLDAIRASISYPFVFKPVKHNDRFFVDGGLSSNLPIFLFEKERQRDGLPVIAFDLVAEEGDRDVSQYGMSQFCVEMLNIALEAGDDLMQQVLRNVHHVRVKTPADIRAMDFDIPKAKREELFLRGYAATMEYFQHVLPHWSQVTNEVERLQALHAEPQLIENLLEVIAFDIETRTPARSVRCNVMLPTESGARRIVAYQFGMDADSDVDLSLALDGGCSGEAWLSQEPVIADLVAAKTDYLRWKMTQAEQNKVRPDRTAMLSVPIFNLKEMAQAKDDADDLPLLGTLSLDTNTPLADTKWTEDPIALDRAVFWADVLAQLLVK